MGTPVMWAPPPPPSPNRSLAWPNSTLTERKSLVNCHRELCSGVTANLFRSVNLFRRNLFTSGSVPDFQKISEFVPDGQRSKFL